MTFSLHHVKRSCFKFLHCSYRCTQILHGEITNSLVSEVFAGSLASSDSLSLQGDCQIATDCVLNESSLCIINLSVPSASAWFLLIQFWISPPPCFMAFESMFLAGDLVIRRMWSIVISTVGSGQIKLVGNQDFRSLALRVFIIAIEREGYL